MPLSLGDNSGSLEEIFVFRKQWVDVISNPMIIANTDVDLCCLATEPDVGRWLAEHRERESTKESKLAPLGNNLKKV